MNDLKTPGLRYVSRHDKTVAYWRASKHIVEIGYPVKTARLWSGPPGTRPTDAEQAEIKQQCQRLQDEMREWHESPESRRRARVKRKTLPGKVYFAACDGLIKIGFTTDLHDRMLKIQSSSTRQVSLVGSMPGTPEMERCLHWIFRAFHVRAEWFDLDEAATAFLKNRIISADRAELKWRVPRVRTNRETEEHTLAHSAQA